jgi:hypothetical protein
VLRGHVGTIYQATNGHYIGRTNPSTLRLLPDGTCYSNRTSGKLAQGDIGRRYAAAQLEVGAPSRCAPMRTRARGFVDGEAS